MDSGSDIGPADRRLVFPIGQLVGALGTPSGTVRIGDRFHALDAQCGLALWGLAHGDESRVGIRPWTVADLLDTADLLGVPDPVAGLRQLLATALVVAVSPDTPGGFATTYRLVPLQVGLGAGPGRRTGFRLATRVGGLPGHVLTEDLYAIWRYAPLTSSLSQLVTDFSRQAAEAGLPAAEAAADVVLRDVLSTLHVLLSRAAGYLDLAHR